MQKAIAFTKEAREEDDKGNYEAAYRLYDSGVEHFIAGIKCKARHSPPPQPS